MKLKQKKVLSYLMKRMAIRSYQRLIIKMVKNIVYSVYVRGSNPSLFSMFIPGTIWKLSYTLAGTPYTYILRLDNVAPDIGCPATSYGIRLCMKVVE